MLAQSGLCGWGTRANLAQSTGASLLIVYGCDPGVCSSKPDHMSADNPLYANNVTIPSIMIHNWDGTPLANALKNGTTVTIHIEGTGPIVQSELDALIQFAQDLPLGNPLYLNSPRLSGATRPWTDLTTNPGDPCVNRVMGIWCINGRIAEFYSSDLNIQGPLPASIGNLTSLQAIEVNLQSTKIRRITGTIPCELGTLTQLVELRLPDNAFTTLIDAAQCWPPLLRGIDLRFNQITSLPTVWSTYSTFRYIDVSENSITNYVSFPLSTALETLNLNDNAMSGTVQTFSVFSNITTINLARNHLSGVIRTYFNSLPYLTFLDVSANQFNGGVPAFSGTSALTSLDISYNSLNGSLSGWVMPKLLTLSIAHNNITGFYPGINSASSLTYFDGSYNQISFPAAIVLHVVSLTCLTINLEHNLLSMSTWNPGLVGFVKGLQVLKYAYNKIKVIPSTLFSELSGLQYVDFSGNPLQGTIPTVPPTRLLLSAKFNNISSLTFNGTIPTYVKPDLTKYVKNSVDSRYYCPSLTGIYTDISLEVDPSYYNYSNCACEKGTYGLPPNCTFLPDFTVVQSPTHFTDAVYGTARLQPGINTLWEVKRDVNPEQIKTIEFDIAFKPDFNGNSASRDTVNIYEGGEDLKGNRVFTLAGSDVENNNSIWLRPGDQRVNSTHYKVRVFSSMATFNFESRDVDGDHFDTTVAFSTECPQGFTDNLGTQCRQLTTYESPVGISEVIYLLMALGLLLMATVAITILHQLHVLVIRASSPLFCFLTLGGLIIFAIAPVTYIQTPTHPATCHLRVWLTALPLVIILSNLLVKVDRIRNIFSVEVFANLQKQYRKFTNERLLATAGMMVGAEIILLMIFSILHLSKPTITAHPSSDVYTLLQVDICTSHSIGYRVWLGLQIGYIGGFLLWGAYLAFRTKDTPTAFNESTHILGALLVLLFFGVILVPLNFMLEQNPEGLLLIRGIGQTFAALILTAIIFGPKLYYIAIGRANDQTMLNTSRSAHTELGSIQVSPSGKSKTDDTSHADPKTPGALPSVVRLESSVRDRVDSTLGSELDMSSGHSPPTTEQTHFFQPQAASVPEGPEPHEELEVV